ncbi:MAG: HAMP domain-containing protein [Anaerolineales bacterium]|nr:HAMP domain-containing protein [Anaerolineales bacterium]MCB9110080.1 HAMP domain-containing protein [Anaerolineales bacterium]
MKYIRERLGAKLFLANLLVILVGIVILAITIQLTIPAAFNRHMGSMNAEMNGMGMGQGQGSGYGKNLFENFRASMFESLGYAVTAAVVAALLVSLFLSRRIVAPIHKLSEASQHIAEGNYEKRVDVNGSDEIGQLAMRFNQMASQLEEVESMRRKLIGDVTHELRTPLTSIKGYMEGLVDGVLPANAETFEQIHHEADRLSRLVDDLQELSRVEAKAYSLDLHPVKVSNLVQTTVKRLSPQATAKRITLRSSLPADLEPILADEDRVTQVLVNLAANAIQYTPEDGEVLISASRHADEIYISVKDSGIGIPPEHIANLFTRFYRVDKSRSRNAGGGSGIGLTIARHLVEAHGGRIWAESAGEGQGSTFTFSMKMAAS